MKALFLSFVLLFSAEVLFAVPRASTELLKLSGSQAAAKAHGPGRWLDNVTSAADPELELFFRFWYDDTNLYFSLKDIAESADDRGGWEIHLTQKNDRGDLLRLTVGPGAKLAARNIIRRNGGEESGKFTDLPDGFGSVKTTFAENIRTSIVTIPIEKVKVFGIVPGTVCFMNFFYLAGNGKVYGWNPTGKRKRTTPWCLGRVFVLK